MKNLLALGKYWAIEPDTLSNLEALMTKDAPFLENTRTVRIQNGVAIIPVSGIITGQMNFLTYVLGGTALDILAKDFRTALENKDVQAIVLDFDSPGGVAVGPAEMADVIFNARGNKPIISYVGRNCCSAAYWLASAADKIVAHPSALLGSIGVVTTVPVQEQADESGTKCYEIVSSNAKAKRPDPRTEDGIKIIKAELDALEAQFIGSIAQFRNISEEKIRNNFGGGGVVIGHEALQRGMVDKLGSLESVLASLTVTSKNERNITMDKTKTETSAVPEITASYIQSQYPEVAKALADEAYNQGIADGKNATEEAFQKGIIAERERILAIEKIAIPGHEDLVAKAKADGSMTAETLAMQMVMAEKRRGITHLASLQTAEKELPPIPEAPATVASETICSEAPLEDRAKAEWNKSAELRREFGNEFEDYVAYKQAEENGSVRILTRK